MATGSAPDLIMRLQRWLPSRWFPAQAVNPDGSVPRLQALLAGMAAGFAAVWTQLQYARAQARLGSASDGWLDLGVADLARDRLPRLSGESDAAYWARVKPLILPKANTRPNIRTALEALTGNPVRMIEPWDPRDTFCWGVGFWGVDSVAHPGNWSNGGARYQGLVQCVLPAAQELGRRPRERFWDGMFWGRGWWWNGSAAYAGGALSVYALINRLKVFGTRIWVRFVTVGGIPVPPAPIYVLLTDDAGDVLTDDEGVILTP